jgi:monovalent cation:H+ antiporter-2, CPA2 family
MAAQPLFFAAFVYLATAVIAVPIARRLGLGSVLGYLLGGVAIGPWALGLVGQEGQDVMHVAEFGVVLMLFVIGLELRPKLLWRLRTPILGLGGLQVLLTTLALGGLGLAFGLTWQVATAVGLALSLSSTAIVLQTLEEKRLLRTDGGQGAFAVLLFQDVSVIPMLALLPLLATLPHAAPAGGGGGHSTSPGWVEGLPAWGQTLAVLGAVASIVLGGVFLARPALRAIARTRMREIFTAAALLMVIGIALLMDQVGLSPALGTFLAGVVLANSEYRHELESDIEPFKGLLLGVFFIAIGATVDFGLIARQPGMVVALVALLIAVKLVVLFALGRLFRMGFDQRLLFAFALAQGGEFAFVLFSFAVPAGVVPPDVAALLIAVVALSMVLTPLLLLIRERLLVPRTGTLNSGNARSDVAPEANPVVIAGFGDFGNVIGRLLWGNGFGCTVLESDGGRVELLRKLGLKVYYGDATRVDLLTIAGAADAELLVIALEDPDQVSRLVRAAREHFPDLTIFARASGRVHAYELIEQGVDHVYRQGLDSSLRLGVDALRALGLRGLQARRAADLFRRRDEETLRELAPVRHDHGAYLSRARELIAELERLMEREHFEEAASIRDHAWDPDSLREEFGGSSSGPGDATT